MPAKIEPPHIARLLDRQVARWQLRQRLAEAGGEAARRELAHLQEGPWVTVSKQLASGGVELARSVAQRLEWQMFDREILDEIARHTHARASVLRLLDEREVGWLEDALKSVLEREGLSHGEFLQEMMRVIWALGRKGHAVILGRGANWLLNPSFGLRVRVVAPVEYRVERLAAEGQLSPAEARARLQADDHERAAFVRQVFSRDIEDALGYDLIVNLALFDLEAAADTVVAALRNKLSAEA